MSVLTPGCNCASRGLAEEHRHGPMCPYGVAARTVPAGHVPSNVGGRRECLACGAASTDPPTLEPCPAQARARHALSLRASTNIAEHDNRLALGQVVDRLERCRIAWNLHHDPSKHTPEFRYEMRIFDGPARAIYHGRTASHAATAAQEALDEHRIGWAE